ncbi:hypothetical protein V2J09_014516 [Rumex salicifolius]
MAQCNWSAEHATNAYLRALQMGKRASDQQPDVSEFISAIAAGNNSQFMVIACAAVNPTGATASAVLALVAAAHQTGGHVICILPTTQIFDQELPKELQEAILNNPEQVECVVGDAETLIVNEYSGADFVVVDCNLDNHDRVLQIVNNHKCNDKGVVVLGYNAFCAASWRSTTMKPATQLLPIGEGLLITRVAGKMRVGGRRKGSNWVVKVDEATGEEHVFRVRIPHGKVVRA